MNEATWAWTTSEECTSTFEAELSTEHLEALEKLFGIDSALLDFPEAA